MVQVNYGVVQQGDRWVIIGENLRFGAYRRRSSADRAARRLAAKSSGLPVQLHLQDESGALAAPERLPPED